MLPNIFISVGLVILGFVFIVWSELKDVRKHSHRLRLNYFQKVLAQLGYILVFMAPLWPAMYGLQHLPHAEQLWLVVLVLFVGLLLTVLAIIDLSKGIVKKTLIFTMRTPLTRVTNRIAEIMTLCLFGGGVFLTFEGFCLLVFILVKG